MAHGLGGTSSCSKQPIKKQKDVFIYVTDSKFDGSTRNAERRAMLARNRRPCISM